MNSGLEVASSGSSSVSRVSHFEIAQRIEDIMLSRGLKVEKGNEGSIVWVRSGPRTYVLTDWHVSGHRLRPDNPVRVGEPTFLMEIARICREAMYEPSERTDRGTYDGDDTLFRPYVTKPSGARTIH